MTRPMFGALHTLVPTDVAIDTKEDQRAAAARSFSRRQNLIPGLRCRDTGRMDG
jgi:hypothetical protein